jgi:ATP-dependent Clp protease ATP-binding subunit ClpB
MNLNNFTIKSQEAIQQAFQVALGLNQQAVDTSHILKGLMIQAENVISHLLKKCEVNIPSFTKTLDKIIESYPKVTGGEQYLSPESTKALQKSIEISQKMGDQYVPAETIILGLLANKDQTAQMMKDAGINEKVLNLAIKEMRKGSVVNSQTSDTTYDALNRYAINLNERASQGKLDPVIGRDNEIDAYYRFFQEGQRIILY